MLAAPIPANDETRLEALREHLCAYTPREERFDSITRTVCELLDVPVALVSIVEQNEQWFRSAQGVAQEQLPRETSFCGHAIVNRGILCINDTLENPDFRDNPLVIHAPFIRAYLGCPLEIMPGLFAGTLCAIDTKPRNFTADDLQVLTSLAARVETELKKFNVSDLKSLVLSELSLDQRQAAMDPLTGCWNAHGFSLLLQKKISLDADANANTEYWPPSAWQSQAICHIQVRYTPFSAPNQPQFGEHAPSSLEIAQLAQQLRKRLSLHNALASSSPHDFYALILADSQEQLTKEIQALVVPMAGFVLTLQWVPLLSEMGWQEGLAALQNLPKSIDLSPTGH